MSTSLSVLADALLLQGGYNAALVAIGAALLGIAAGAGGTFLFLRKRALVSDAIAHATLPGVGLAFLAMVAFGLDGRSLIGLIAGSALSAAAGLFAVEWITRRTRLAEDTAIGAVLSVFFGFGIVLLTVIQTQSQGRQAGLEGVSAGLHRRHAVPGCRRHRRRRRAGYRGPGRAAPADDDGRPSIRASPPPPASTRAVSTWQ